MKERKTRSYDKEFKLNAVKLYLKSGHGFKQIADELGIPFSCDISRDVRQALLFNPVQIFTIS